MFHSRQANKLRTLYITTRSNYTPKGPLSLHRQAKPRIVMMRIRPQAKRVIMSVRGISLIGVTIGYLNYWVKKGTTQHEKYLANRYTRRPDGFIKDFYNISQLLSSSEQDSGRSWAGRTRMDLN
jgi:hypothetical protein